MRSWTKGPWSVVERGGIYTVTSPHGNPVNCYEVADTWRHKGDAALIALAPEMAEAILNVADEFRRYGEQGGTYDEVLAVAEKLRALDKEAPDA